MVTTLPGTGVRIVVMVLLVLAGSPLGPLLCWGEEAFEAGGEEQEESSQVVAVGGDSLPRRDSAPDAFRRNPVVAAGLSAALPGAGQVYDGRYIRAGLFMAAEAAFSSSAYYWHNNAQKHEPGIARLKDTLAFVGDSFTVDVDTLEGLDGEMVLDTTDIDTLAVLYRMKLDTARAARDRKLNQKRQSICWAVGCYLYNIADAIDKSRSLGDDQPRSPLLAGWLSAVPALGLGQLYNGELAKAGLIWMVQSGLGYLAYNNHRMVLRSEEALRHLDNPKRSEYGLDQKNAFIKEWQGIRSDAFRERNMYLWYSLLFYFYGIFDAVVDAHLHDYRERMRLEPDLRPSEKAIGLNLSFTY